MSYNLLAVYGLGGRATSRGLDEILAPFSEDADYRRSARYTSAESAVREIATRPGKKVVLVNSLGWRTAPAVEKYLADDDVLYITLDPAKVQRIFPPWVIPLDTPLDRRRHLNIWQESNIPQDFGPVEGAENIRWKERGHVELDDRPGVQSLVQERIRNFLQAQNNPEPPMNTVPYRLTTKVLDEIASHEGLVQEAYKDSVGVWTWSIGITSASGHRVERYIDNPAPIDRCVEVYVWLLDTKYLQDVKEAMQGRALTLNQLAGACSFHWNTGAIKRATWVDYFLAGDMVEAERRFLDWDQPPEIRDRRQREADLFFRNVWTGNGVVTHYTRLKSNKTPDWSSGVALDLTSEFDRALNEHYAPVTPEPPQPPAIPPLEPAPPSFEAIRADILAKMPSLEPRDADLWMLENLYSPPDITSAESTAFTRPASEPGFSLKPGAKQMTFNFLNTSSKTFWTGAVMVLAGLVGMMSGEGNAFAGLVTQFFGDTEPGLLIANGLAVIFGREAIAKVGK